MRRLFCFISTTLDGYYEGPNQEFDFWTVDDAFLEFSVSQLRDTGVLLLGRVTYEGMAAYYPTEAARRDTGEIGELMNALPKIVFSTTLTGPPAWANTTIVDEPVETAVPALKAAADGVPMRTVGSPSLVRSLFELGLVDRVRTMVFPTIHGADGEGPLYAGLPHVRLDLTSTTVVDDRLVLLDYRVDAG